MTSYITHFSRRIASQDRDLAFRAVAFAIAMVTSTAAMAEEFPTRAIKLVIGFSAGGTTDILARLLASQMSRQLGQPIVVENKPGASGTLAADVVAKSPPNGYTLMLTTTSVHGIAPGLFKKLPYDSYKDFSPISLVSKSTMVLITNNQLPVRSVSDVIALAKKKPGGLAYASSGPGSTAHLVASMFSKNANIEMLHVPYKGGGSSVSALMSGEVQLAFDNIASTRSFIAGQRVRAIAVTSSKRSPSLPDVPTFAEAGLPKFEFSSWSGLVAPAGVPKDIIRKLNEAANKALQSEEIRNSMSAGDTEPQGGSPEEFAQFLASEQKRWGESVRQAGVTLD